MGLRVAPTAAAPRVPGVDAGGADAGPPGVVETWWVSHEDAEQLRRGRSSTGYDDQVTAKITANLGFDTERGVFSDLRGNDEAALVRDPRRAGLSVGQVSRHDVGGVPVLATNVLFLYYTAAGPNGRRAHEVWGRFKAALLRSGGLS